jgi:pyridoxamine 5'-phosphate oxidase
MIQIKNLSKSEPYIIFEKLYKDAVNKDQKHVEAICISSYDETLNIPDSRYVNLKYIIGESWTFFSNYNSPKSRQYDSNDNISAILFWNSINVQIRIKAKIHRSDEDFSDQHFSNRNPRKNAIAISSMQSQNIESYEKIIENYEKAIKNKNVISNRPEYWGGYTFKPYYFEFWQGHEHRINKRDVFFKKDNHWKQEILQP